MATCNCYVARLSAEAQFTLRYGAHSLNCPVYRPSLDPVDQLHDSDWRAYHEGLVPIFTRFGTPVEIRYRCDDYNPETGEGFVHAFDLEEPNSDPMVVPLYELRAKGGAGTILDTAANAPIAHCTGKHEGNVAKTGLDRAFGR